MIKMGSWAVENSDVNRRKNTCFSCVFNNSDIEKKARYPNAFYCQHYQIHFSHLVAFAGFNNIFRLKS